MKCASKATKLLFWSEFLRHTDFPESTIPCGGPVPFLSQALHFHDDTSPLTPCSQGRDPVPSEHKPAQSERSAHWQKHPKAFAPMTVCDIRSDSFSITTNTLVLCEDSVFVSTKQAQQSAEKMSDFLKKKKKKCWNVTLWDHLYRLTTISANTRRVD